MRKAIGIVGLCFLASLLFTPHLFAESSKAAENLIGPAEIGSGWRLRADYFTYDERQGTYSASGNVSLRSQDRLIKADRIRLDGTTRQTILEGRVRIEQGEDWLEAERAVLDLKERTGTIEHGTGFLAEGHFYFSGELIEKLGPQTYHAEKARFTTCDGDRPAWHFRASDLKITVDGYAFAKHSRFHLRSVPVLYSPYLAFPAKTTRQSGFLLPLFGTSDLLGTDIDLPFFWAISRSTDATLYGHYMSKRGFMPGAEFRYAVSESGKGTLRFDYIYDQGGEETLRTPNLSQIEPEFSGEDRDRWWWRSKQNFILPHQVQGRMDLDFVSDRSYLREFETGYSSWVESNSVFLKTFGRGLINDESVTTRESTLLLNRTWAAHSVNGELHYFQNLDPALDERTLQQLPLVGYSASRQPLFKGPFFWQGNATYVNYWRQEGTRGHRLEILPRLALPLRWANYLEVEPSVGFMETLYLIPDYDEPTGSSVEEKTFQHRELFEGRVEVNTEIMRVFTRDNGGRTKTRHTLRPEIVYEYIPKVDQDQLPSFDSTDRISNRNRLIYSLTNFFVARLEENQDDVTYQDFARLKFSQFYDLEEPELDVRSGTSQDRPFSNVFTQLDVTPKRYLKLTYKNEWSVYDGDFKLQSILANLWDKRGDKISVDYNLQRDEDGRIVLSEIDGRLSVTFWGGVSMQLRSNYSFEENQNFETEYLVLLNRQCWGIGFSYLDKPDDRRFMIGFTLYGVGELQPQTLLSFD
jgi:LPS-assembly protein